MNDNGNSLAKTNGHAVPAHLPAVRATRTPSRLAAAGAQAAPRPTLPLLLSALRKRLALALVVGLVVGVGVAAAAWELVPPNKHSVSAKIWLKETRDTLLFPAKKEANFAMYQRTQAALIKSRHVLTTALEKPEVKKLSLMDEVGDPITDLEKRVTVDFKDSPEILRISMEGDRANELKVIIDAIAAAYLYHFDQDEERTREQKLKELHELKKSYAERLTAKRAELYNLTKGIKAPNLGTIQVNQQVAVMLLSLADKELIQVQQQRLKLEAELAYEQRKYFDDFSVPLYASPASGLPTPLVVATLLQQEKVSDPPARPTSPAPATVKDAAKDDLLAGYLKRKLELEKAIHVGLAQAFNPEVAKKKLEESDAELQAILLKIADRRKELGQLFQEPVDPPFVSQLDYLKHQLAVLTQFEVSLQKEIRQQEKLRDNLAQASLDMEMIRKDVERAEKTYDTVTSLIESLDVEKRAPPRLVPLQSATIYPPPVLGRREVATGLGGAGALLLILAGFALVEFRARRIDSREQIVRTLGLDFIGAVPNYRRAPRLGLAGPGRARRARDQIVIDSVDAVRTALLAAARETQLRIVLVTSAWVDEGKTATAHQLAASLARAGQRTLLVDCDLRNPDLHKLARVPRGPGLSEVLRGAGELGEAIRASETERLFFLPAGECPGQTIQSLSDRRVAETLAKLRPEFDFIILDSSPVLIAPETQMFSQHADGVIISVMRNVSKVPKVYAACDLLERLRTRILGFVLNGACDIETNPAYYTLPHEPAHAR